MISMYQKLVADLFHEGRWIDGRAYIVCKECGTLIPADNDTIHYDWHSTLNRFAERLSEINERP